MIRVGMIGVGAIAQGHLDRLLALPEVEIAALADPSEASLQKTRERLPNELRTAQAFADHRQMLETVKPDAVLVCTPHTQHFRQAMDSLKAGAHVLLEKPMVSRVSDAHALLKKIDATKKVVGIAYQRHGAPHFRYIREKIASGEFGEVQFVSALQQQCWTTLTAGKWQQDPALSGGGQINDSGSHLLDIVMWIAGLFPAQVTAFMDNRGTPVDVNSTLSVKFTNGAQGSISIIGDAGGWYEDITVWCRKGAFFVRSNSGFHVQEWSENIREGGKWSFPEPADMPSASDVDTNFIHAVQGKEEIFASPLDGLRTIELTEAAWKSAAASGQPTAVK